MAQGNYKVNQEIEVTYQAPNAATGKTVNMEVYDETHTIVAGGPTVLSEIVSRGRYYGTFTPGEEGIWNVEIEVSDGTGKVVKQYAVAGHDVDSIGDAIATVDGKVALDTTVAKDATVSKDATVAKAADTALETTAGGIKAKTDNLPGSPAASGEAATAESNIRGADSDTLESLSDQLDVVTSPPMVG